MSTPESVVRDFCSAFSRLDVDEIVGFFSEDAVYHNIPIAPVKGREAIRTTLLGFIGPSSQGEFEVLNLAVAGDKVFTERIDRFTIGDKEAAIPVMGIFEVDGAGKITAWRDYFDMNQFTSQLG